MSEQKKHYKIAILGGGVTGSAIFYLLSRYTNIDDIVLIEKESRLGEINSHESNNSQTLHFGDIETNYSLEKARKTKSASEMVVRFLNSLEDDDKKIFTKSHKLALAVGASEVETLEKRFLEFSQLFPEMKLIDKEEIAKVEPKIVEGRSSDQPIKAFYSENSYVVDFGGLAHCLTKEALKHSGNEIILGEEAKNIRKDGACYSIRTANAEYSADIVIVSMCAHSLMFAKQLGYGKNLSILPVGGNFYTANSKLLNGKVYTMQSGKLPFAAVHGDPNIYNEDQTRFGPTANIMPFLERNNLKTFFDFLATSWNNPKACLAFLRVVFSPVLFSFLFKSLVYELPYFGPLAFSKLAKKIIPNLHSTDFFNGKTKAGIRPQLIDIEAGKLMMGETEIKGDNIFFYITPSPGATSCLYNAEKTVRSIIELLPQNRFDTATFRKELIEPGL